MSRRGNELQQLQILTERLRRHYQHTVRTYDVISLQDLSHALRMWADAKEALPQLHPKLSSGVVFKVGSPIRKVTKAAANSTYMFAYSPEPTITYANKGQLFSMASTPSGDFHAGAKFRLREDGGTEMSQFAFASRGLQQELGKSVSQIRVSRCHFSQWLGAEIARYRFVNSTGGITKSVLTREQLIRRVANTMDGSHPSFVSEESFENELNEHVRFLMSFRWGALPLPYMLLLNTAQVILEKADAISGVGSTK